MSGHPSGAGGVALTPMRRAWLRELGIERIWRAPATAAAAARTVEAASGAAVAGGALLPAVASPAVGQDTPPAAVQPPISDDEAWARLQEEVAHCTRCGLCQGRTQTVFGVGARQASWMIVGEAPGEQEDRQGKPFVGRSGKLLDAMLAAVGRSRERGVFIANVIKCRPPGNRDPQPEEVAQCSPYLMRQIELVQPAAILVLGRFAAQTLLNTDARIGSLRGRVHHTDVQGRKVPVVVSYHPAYLLRSPHEKSKAWQDLQLAESLSLAAG
ncbi:uracil-DNA glycosylase [Pigmentiphaga soli]|uniref:Type-4 uracil-DNA glycosylase n=1 Tax=Pigmentiphaga soli TaxID=1007095 RepID=A0ABP8HEG7_9BURK